MRFLKTNNKLWEKAVKQWRKPNDLNNEREVISMGKIKLGVIFGGMSTEHSVSIVSGT